jgi:prevent-host-death family protein
MHTTTTSPTVPASAPRGPGRLLALFCHFVAKLTTMTRIAVAEAKARFSELLDRVSRGERFLVLRHGRPMAALVPAGAVASPAPAPAGLAALAGSLAEWEDLDAVVADIYAARRRAGDRAVPPLD